MDGGRWARDSKTLILDFTLELWYIRTQRNNNETAE